MAQTDGNLGFLEIEEPRDLSELSDGDVEDIMTELDGIVKGLVDEHESQAPRNAWWDREDAQQEIKTYARSIGLPMRCVVEALSTGQDEPIDRVAMFPGSLDQAKELMRQHQITRIADALDELNPTPERHTESQVIAWTNISLPNGARANLTVRAGADLDTIVATPLLLVQALTILEDFGIKASK